MQFLATLGKTLAKIASDGNKLETESNNNNNNNN
jgi:hypothetical protein